jgi:hypothetical protein
VYRSRFADPARRASGIRMGEAAVLGGGSMPRPLGPLASIAISDTRVHVGVGDSTRLLAYSLGTAQASTVPLQLERRAPSRAMHDASIQRSLAMVPLPVRGRASQMAATIPLREQMPTHGDIFADPSGTLWITTTFPGDPATRLLAVDQNGRTIGSLTLPRNIAVHEVGTDYVLGVYSDEDELPHVVLYRFRRGA